MNENGNNEHTHTRLMMKNENKYSEIFECVHIIIGKRVQSRCLMCFVMAPRVA